MAGTSSRTNWFKLGVSLLVLLVLILARVSIPLASAETLGSWTQTSTYSSVIAYPSCATYDGYIYCVGGYYGSGEAQDEVEYAQLSTLVSSPDSDTTWKSATSYPVSFDGGSCAIDTSIGYIYCVGGGSGSSFNDNVYYAHLSASGGLAGSWTSTTVYPFAMASLSCAIDSNLNYIYCIGGTADTEYPQTPSDAEEYAPVSSSGVGSWTGSTFLTDIDEQSCDVASGYIYCVGGLVVPQDDGSNPPPDPNPDVYYAATSTSGLSWSSTTAYPIDIAATSCATSGGYIYCVGGETALGGSFTNDVYYATAGSSGIGTWESTSAYPSDGYEGIDYTSCGVSGSDLVCVGGLEETGDEELPEVITGSVNYAQISGGSTSTTSSGSSSSSSSSSSTTTTSSSTSSSSPSPPRPTPNPLPTIIPQNVTVTFFGGSNLVGTYVGPASGQGLIYNFPGYNPATDTLPTALSFCYDSSDNTIIISGFFSVGPGPTPTELILSNYQVGVSNAAGWPPEPACVP